jgi:hypothetical protein
MSRQLPATVARIREMYRGGSGGGQASPPASRSGHESPDDVADLRARVAHLEELVQGLQDSVHRASERQDKRISDIERRLDPTAIAAALSQNARERGL